MAEKIKTIRSGPPTRYRNYFTWSYLHPRYWLTWTGFGLLWLVSRLPFNAQLGLGRALGISLYYLLPSRRHVTLTNIALAFPHLSATERIELAKENYRHVGMSLAEMATFWFRPTEWFIHRIQLQGKQHLADAMAEGKGVVLLQAHFTLVDFSASIMCQDYQAYAVFAKAKNQLFGSMLRYRRERYMQAMIENRDIRSMIKLLKKGALIWYSPDQTVAPSHGGIEVEYFGQPALTTPGTARIAAMTGARVIPMVPTRHSIDGTYSITFYPPLALPDDDHTAATREVNSVFETQVRQQPEQYFWMHKRFKKADKQQHDPYKS